MLSTILTDLRMAVRAARRQPAFTAVVVATLALGIGANTAMFALIHAALLKPLPYTDPDRLVLARRTIGTRLLMWNSAPDFYDYLEQATDLEALSATRPEAARVTLTGGERPEILRGGEVSYDLFSTLGVSPINGRLFTPDEGRAGAPYVALITDGLARRRFGDAASAVGRTLPLTGIGPSPVLATVVGVMPATYRFLYDADLWMPMHRGERDGPETRQFHNWVLVGRLKPGASVAGAQRQVDVIATRLQQEYPSSNKGKGLRLDPLQSALFEAQTPRLLLLMGAVGLVLFIACANVAGLLLARGVSRRSELAVRAALGASKLRIAGQLLTESLLLAAVSGVLGTVLALGLQRVLPVASGLAQSGVEVRGLNPMVLLFALALSIVTALLSGVVPALRASSHSLVGHLAPGIRSTESRGGTRLRSVLVVGQVAVSLALLVGAGLLLRSFAKLATTDLGFNPTHLLTGSVRVPEADPARRIQFFNELQKSFAAIPGVTAVAFNSHIPIRDAAGDPPMWRSDRPPVDASDTGTADLRIVLPGSVRAMGIPLLLGRDITDSDNIDAPPVLVINQVMARTLFPGESALGGRITVAGADRDFEVVGVVGDARIDSVGRSASMTMYASYSQVPRPSMNFLLRTALPPDAVAQSVRRVVETRNPDIAVENLVSMDEILGDSLTAYRVTTVTLGLFSIVALLLSSLGLYGVLAYYVSTRIHEIGVRMALGAEQSAILRHVAAQSATMVVPGIVLGVVAALAGGRLVQSMLYNVEPTDAATFVGVTAALGLVALVATAWPAWRAARTDPARALRSE